MRIVWRLVRVALLGGLLACQGGSGGVSDGGQTTGATGTGGASGGHSTGGVASGGAAMAGGAGGGVGGAGAGGMATGGSATGGMFVPSACQLAGGTCLTSCTQPCESGRKLSQPNGCPVSESNAVCGAQCCLPPATGGQGGSGGQQGSQGVGGAGGHAGVVACGSGSNVTCAGGTELCYSFIGGTAGSQTMYSCRAVPTKCTEHPTCACVCPPTTGGLGCDFGSLPLYSCTCSDTNGLRVSCAGQ